MPVFVQGILFVVGFILLVFVLPLSTWSYFLKKRTRKLQEVALELGFSFKEKGDGSLTRDFSNLPLFQSGDHRYEENVMTKSTGHATVTILDFNYVDEGTDFTPSPHIQTVTCFKSEELNLPPFCLRPERILDKMIGKKLLDIFGYNDINFDSYPEFSKKYLLYGKNEEAIRNLFFNSGIINFCERGEKLYIEGQGNNLIVYRHMQQILPQDIQSFLYKTEQVYSMFTR